MLSALPTSPAEIGAIMFGIVAVVWEIIVFLEMLFVWVVFFFFYFKKCVCSS